MKIQLNTDNHIQGDEALKTKVAETIHQKLQHFADHITRIEVHLSDENAFKGGLDDIQCKLEARIEGKQPVLVSSKSDSKEKAVNDALNKMKATLTSVMEK